MIGTPTPAGINGPDHDLCYNGRTSEIGQFRVFNPINSLTYYWQIDGLGAGIGSTISVNAFTWDVGTHQIRVISYSAACGYSSWYTSSFIIIDCSGFRVSISPNPANTNIVLQVDELSMTKNIYNNPEWMQIREIKIFDKLGVLRKKIQYGAGTKSVVLLVYDLPSDIYNVDITNGVHHVIKQIVVQR